MTEPITILANGAGGDVSTVLTVFSSLVVVPLGIITFYLRSLRDQQTGIRTDLGNRIDHLDTTLQAMTQRINDYERDFTSKEEWLRESMLARHNLQRLGEAFARIEAGMDLMTRVLRVSPGPSTSAATSTESPGMPTHDEEPNR